MAEQMTGAEMVIQALTDQGVEFIFGYPGGAALPIYDALFQQDTVQHILVRQQQCCAFCPQIAVQCAYKTIATVHHQFIGNACMGRYDNR